MAINLRNAAVKSVGTGHPSSFYTTSHGHGKNPVYQALDQEILQFKSLVSNRREKLRSKLSKKKTDGTEGELFSRCSNTLFDLWNKYEKLLPSLYFEEKLLEIGDFLTSVGEYQLALWQCYGRYLRGLGDIEVEEIKDEEEFALTFFSNGFDAENTGFTFRALMGKAICTYQMLQIADAKLQNKQTLDRCLQLLSFLRLVTQVVLRKEKLCWLVYNGTVYIYTVCRRLMSFGYSRMVIEYLLWACCCMEVCVPLLTVKYLRWRSTLYTTVCQCHFDCKSSSEAEAFARRALSKINELSQLECLSSSSPSGTVESAFREATIRMAIMVFKRTVFETRRRPKGILRPKTRVNLKDAILSPWPRTQSERLLIEMMEGSSAQLLCILEALSDSNRRVFQHGPAASESESEILDVYAELVLAAQEIIAGGGGKTNTSGRIHLNSIPGLQGLYKEETDLLSLAVRGADGVTLPSVVRLIKWAFCYEQWECFESLAQGVLNYLKNSTEGLEGVGAYYADEKVLELLLAMKAVHQSKRGRRVHLASATIVGGPEGQSGTTAPSVTMGTGGAVDATVTVSSQASMSRRKSEIGSAVTAGVAPTQSGAFEGGISSMAPTAAHGESGVVEHHPGEGGATVMSERTQKQDELLVFVEVLQTIIDGPLPAEAYDLDVLMDAVIFLWQKCKAVFQKYQTGSLDNARYLQRMENVNKWVFILDVVHRGLGWTGVSTVDPSMSAEVVLRLALVLESSAHAEENRQAKSVSSRPADTPTQHIACNSATAIAQKSAMGVSKSTILTARDESQAAMHTSSQAHENSGANVGHESVAAMDSASDVNTSGVTMSILRQPPRAQLAMAREILELGLRNISMAREAVALADGESIADVVWAKDLNPELFEPLNEQSDAEQSMNLSEMSASSGAVWNTVKDLQLELLLMYHRICIKIVDLDDNDKTAKKQPKSNKGEPMKSFDTLLTQCNKNQVSKALLLMQRTHMLSTTSGAIINSKNINKHLIEAESLLNKAMAEERVIFTQNGKDDGVAASRGSVPPPPILLCRTDTKMTFRPAAWIPPKGQRVVWYRLYARPVKGSNVKVRLNDYNIVGTAQEVPAFNCELSVYGLVPNEKYMFAVAAYTADGQIIGGAVGESTKPILAAHPMSMLVAWAYLCQISYQCGMYDVTKRACQLLWSHFVAMPPPPQLEVICTTFKDFKLTYHYLNHKIVKQTSQVLLRQFLTSLFISVDVHTIEKRLYCDALSDQGPLYPSQTSRLLECEKMLVGINLTGWLNETNLGLQCVITAYGLLAPLIHYKMQTIPVVQILKRCLAVLMEVPSNILQKRGSHGSESVYHMAACITYYVSRTLRTWHEVGLANHVSESGRKLLGADVGQDTNTSKRALAAQQAAQATNDGDQSDQVTEIQETLTIDAFKKKKSKRSQKDDAEANATEELKAIEAYLLSISKQIISSYMFDPKYWELGQGTGDHELTGNEDPTLLHAYIAFLPSKVAYKEVGKFRRRNRYLEFFVQVLGKALSEGIVESAIDWARETVEWLDKRNESILGSKMYVSKQPGAVTIQTNDPKKHHIAVAEFMSKEKEDPSPRSKGKLSQRMKKKPKYKPLRVAANMSDAQRQAQEEMELKALEVLTLYLPDMVKKTMRRRRYRQISAEEMPWKSQLHLITGLCHFGLFSQKLEMRGRLFESNQRIFHTAYLDQEWFTLDCSGSLLFMWQTVSDAETSTAVTGSKSTARRESRMIKRLAQTQTDRKVSALEVAARAVTAGGRMPTTGAPTATGPDQVGSSMDGEETPRTYRSEFAPGKDMKKKVQEEVQLVSPQMLRDTLEKAFQDIKKAAILAHRGRHWTLLQNAGEALWNSAHTALLNLNCEPDLIPVEGLRQLLWEPFYITADCLLDMIQMYKETQESLMEKAKGPKSRSTGGWLGGPEEDSGGASLRFDPVLDERSNIDLRWLRRFIPRTLEILYHEEKWERLVHLAMRFNGLTSNRYAEQISPLIVQAQRQIIERIEVSGGISPPQLPFMLAMSENGGKPIKALDYLNLQLKTVIDKQHLKKPDPGAQIDPQGMNVYEDGRSARQNSCVPLDLHCTLDEFRRAMEDSTYVSRALRHSRQLMTLYLAGQQQGNSGISKPQARVDFVPTTARPQPSVPPDKSKDEFRYDDDVKSTPLPKSQFSIVLISYEKTIELLLSRNQKSLAAQAMRELGSLYYHANDRKRAFSWWCDCLDLVLGIRDSLRNWRSVAGDKSQDEQVLTFTLLNRCGLWGCILGGAVAANIAQYIVTADLGLKIECCFLAGCMFKALFRSTLPHPLSDRHYALYDIGEGCEVTSLIPGINLLSDKFRMDGRALEAALRYVVEELSRAGHDMFVLPLVTLYLYLVTQVCRDVGRSVSGRILRLRVLTNLGLFHEACLTLIQLLWGERLPQAFDSNFRQVESRPPDCSFDTGKPILAEENLKTIDRLLTKRLSASLAATYGPHLTCRLSVAHANLLCAVSASIQALPEYPKVNMQQINMQVSSLSTNVRPSKKRKASIAQRLASAEELDARSVITQVNSTLQADNLKFTDEMMKGLLLRTSTDMFQSISDAILEAASVEDVNCSTIAPAELELVVDCLLGLARVARLRQHARTGARFAQQAMRLMTVSRHLQPGASHKAPMPPGSRKKGVGENQKLELENFMSRGRLDVRLWLTCRVELVECLLAEVRGMGEASGREKQVLSDVPDLRAACLEGISEAEACGDAELKSRFLLQLGRAELMEGKPVDRVKQVFDEMLLCLSDCQHLSLRGHGVRAMANLQLADLHLMSDDRSEAALDQGLQSYLSIHDDFLNQIEIFGEKVERHVKRSYRSTLVSPMTNLYLPLLPWLLHVKLRLTHCLARKAAFRQNNEYLSHKSQSKTSDIKWDYTDELSDWIEAMGVAMTALEISQAMVGRCASMEAEILLTLGKILRHLMQHGLLSSKPVARALVQGLSIVYHNSHDLGLIRQFYFEIALTYLISSGMISIAESGSVLSSPNEEQVDVDQLTSGSKTNKKPQKKWQSKKEREATRAHEASDEQRERRAAWLALRCAFFVGKSQQALIGLQGESGVELTVDQRTNLPHFLCYDLVSTYVLGERKQIFRNEIEEELSQMPEAQLPPESELYEDQVSRVKDATGGMTWTSALGYYSLLQQLCVNRGVEYASIISLLKNQDEDGEEEPNIELNFENVKIPDIQRSFGHRHAVRTPLFDVPWSQRLAILHQYFTDNWAAYRSKCCAIFPPDALCLEESGFRLEAINEELAAFKLSVFYTSYRCHWENLAASAVSADNATNSFVQPLRLPGSQDKVVKPSDTSLLSTNESDIILQFYRPGLDPVIVQPNDCSILLLFAGTTKIEKSASWTGAIRAGSRVIDLNQLMHLYMRLRLLAQHADLLSTQERKKRSDEKTTKGKEKVGLRGKSQSPKPRIDPLIELATRSCLDQIMKVLCAEMERQFSMENIIPDSELERIPEAKRPLDLPFEITKEILKQLQYLFDPVYGGSVKAGKNMSFMTSFFFPNK